MEVSSECEHCGEETPIKEGTFIVCTSLFEKVKEDDKNYLFYLSAGYSIDKAKEFVTKTRMQGHFAVMMPFEDMPDVAPLQFQDLLEKDVYE